MKATRGIVGVALASLTLMACGGGSVTTEPADMAQAQGGPTSSKSPNIAPPWLGTVKSTTYDGNTDDLLTAGLGKTGLAAGAALSDGEIVALISEGMARPRENTPRAAG